MSANGSDSVDWLSDAEMTAWRGLRRLGDIVLAAVNRDLYRDSKLSEADYEVLTHLSETTEPHVGFSELTSLARWTTSRLSHQLGRMEQRGLIERTPDPDDARVSNVVITDEGRRAITRAAPDHLRSVRRHVFDALDERHTRQLGDIISRLLDHHDKVDKASTGGRDGPVSDE